MATKITYFQVPVCAQETEALQGAREVVDRSKVISHAEAATCQVVGVEDLGGGSAEHILLHVVAFESVPEDGERSGRDGRKNPGDGK